MTTHYSFGSAGTARNRANQHTAATERHTMTSAADIDTRIQAAENAPHAPESWHLNRCGTKGCDQFGTQRVDLSESWYLMCEMHAAEYADAALRVVTERADGA